MSALLSWQDLDKNRDLSLMVILNCLHQSQAILSENDTVFSRHRNLTKAPGHSHSSFCKNIPMTLMFQHVALHFHQQQLPIVELPAETTQIMFLVPKYDQTAITNEKVPQHYELLMSHI